MKDYVVYYEGNHRGSPYVLVRAESPSEAVAIANEEAIKIIPGRFATAEEATRAHYGSKIYHRDFWNHSERIHIGLRETCSCCCCQCGDCEDCDLCKRKEEFESRGYRIVETDDGVCYAVPPRM